MLTIEHLSKKSELEKIQNSVIGYKEKHFGFAALMKKSDLPDGNFETAKPNLEDINILRPGARKRMKNLLYKEF